MAVILVLIVIILFLVMKKSEQQLQPEPGKGFKTLGMRLNNPGCMNKTDSKWIGLLNSHHRFAAFTTMELGIRANLLNLRNGYLRKGLNTVSQIINKYAPPSENKTSAYQAFLVQKFGNIKVTEKNIHILAFYIFQYETGNEFGEHYSINDVKKVSDEYNIF